MKGQLRRIVPELILISTLKYLNEHSGASLEEFGYRNPSCHGETASVGDKSRPEPVYQQFHDSFVLESRDLQVRHTGGT